MDRLLGACLLFCAAAAGGFAADLEVSAFTDRRTYAPRDTVLIVVQARVPKGYRLYANPLGPGIGRPLNIWMQGAGSVTWTSLKRTAPVRHYPDVGGWVWAHEGVAYFFLHGTVAPSARGEVHEVLRLEGLLCQASCRPVELRVPVGFIVDKKASLRNPLTAGPRIRRLLAQAEPMDMGPSPRPAVVRPATTVVRDEDATALRGESPAPQPRTGTWKAAAPASTPPQGPTQGAAPAESATVDSTPPDSDQPVWDYQAVDAAHAYNVWIAMVLAFLAGILLNVMPCVLPVLGIKILSFSQHGRISRRVAFVHSLFFAAGIITVFLVLASLAAFAGFSWGQQFQNPVILIGIIAAIVLFGLGQFELFTIAIPGPVGNLERQTGDGALGNFLKGMLATVLSTPCSGPLLGATLAWTLLQPPAVVFAVFIALGSGMSSPYILLSTSRRIARLIPRPGRWTNDFKHLTGFILLGFGAYLLVGLPAELTVPTLGFCLCAALAAGLWSRLAPPGAGWRRSAMAAAVAAVIAGAGLYLMYGLPHQQARDRQVLAAGEESGVWVDFSPSLLLDAHARGQHVLINFTATWCMNCQYNRITVLQSRQVADLLRKKEVLALKADLTAQNPAAESLLHHLGSRSIPFLAIFKGDDPYSPVIMRDILDKKSLVKELRDLREK